MSNPVCIYPLVGLPEISPQTDLGELLHAGLTKAQCWPLQPDDVLCVAQKVVSKAEGRVVDLMDVKPSTFAHCWAQQWGRDPRLIELVLQESVRIVRQDRGVLIVETRHGLVCANAGVDLSNTGSHKEMAVLLPKDANASAQRLHTQLTGRLGKPTRLGVLIADSFGRPWRVGLTQVVIGAAGMPLLHDLREACDTNDRPLQSTQICIADELAGAADLVCGKTKALPAALIRGYVWPLQTPQASKPAPTYTGSDLIRPAPHDLFR